MAVLNMYRGPRVWSAAQKRYIPDTKSPEWEAYSESLRRIGRRGRTEEIRRSLVRELDSLKDDVRDLLTEAG